MARKSGAAAEGLKINFREIFRVVRFSTFATISEAKQTFRDVRIRKNSESGNQKQVNIS